MSVKEFFKKAFSDMKEDAKAQHEVDKASFAAAKARSRASFEEAKAKGDPERRRKMAQAEREKKIAEAEEIKREAEARIDALKK